MKDILEAQLGGTQSPAAPLTQFTISESPVDTAASLLGGAWPPDGSRYETHLALAGALMEDWEDPACIAFMRSVYAVAGGGSSDHAMCLRTSRACATPTGWPTVEKRVDPVVVAKVRKLLWMEALVIPGVEEMFPGGLGEAEVAEVVGESEDPLNVLTHGEKKDISFAYACYILSQAPAWKDVFRFDVLSRKHVVVNPPFPMRMQQGNFSDGDVGKIRAWFHNNGYKISAVQVRSAVARVCEESGRAYNAFVEYLDALPPASGNLALVHKTILKVDDPFASVLFTKTLVAAVRRGRSAPDIGRPQPLVDHQGVLVLSGDQGVGKGRLVKILAGPWYASVDISRLKDKDTVLKCQGSILVELEEMSTSGTGDRNALKRFLSASDDFERGSYERSAEKVARTYAMIATTNDAQLEDPTGHRRMWPIILRPGVAIDHEMATALRDALWSEANALAATDYDHHLTPAEAARCAADAKLLERDDANAYAVSDACAGKTFVTMQEVYDHVTKGTKKDAFIPRRDEKEIADSLRRLGCVMTRQTDGSRTRGWTIPGWLTTSTLSHEGQAYRASLEVAAGLRAITKN